MSESIDCSVCTEPFTSVTRTKISCGYCSYIACKTCVVRYLLSQTSDAHCMNCRTGWNREFIDQNMTKSFRTGVWREHSKNMFMNREKAILPNFQKYAAAKKKMLEIHPKVDKANKIFEEINAKKNSLNTTIINRINLLAKIRNQDEEVLLLDEQVKTIQEYSETLMQYTTAHMKSYRVQESYTYYQNIYYDTKKDVEKKEFIMKCVIDGCRGFLSQSYKCELCSTYVCKDCMIPKSQKNDDTHVCKKDDIDTVALIRKETRPCPKCGIRISKIDGCDQMWCTAADCGTAFSWISGKVISGTIHNPHYYEWLRRNNGEIPRTPGDVACGGLPDMFHNILSPLRSLGMVSVTFNYYYNSISTIYACLSDLEHARIPNYIVARDPNMLKEIHVSFLLNEIDEDKWRASIYSKENAFEKKLMIGQIIQTFYNAGADLMRKVNLTIRKMQTKKATTLKYVVNDKELYELNENLNEFNNLRKYINEAFEKLAETASMAVPQFTEDWRWQSIATLERIRATNAAKLMAK